MSQNSSANNALIGHSCSGEGWGFGRGKKSLNRNGFGINQSYLPVMIIPFKIENGG